MLSFRCSFCRIPPASLCDYNAIALNDEEGQTASDNVTDAPRASAARVGYLRSTSGHKISELDLICFAKRLSPQQSILYYS